MSALQKLFKHTFIYGIATVLPRVLSVLLTRLYTDKLPTDEYGIVIIVFAGIIFFNVVLSYGMETAFFRFINKSDRKKEVQSTALTSIFLTSLLFLALTLGFRDQIAQWLDIKTEYIRYAVLILTLDALVVIPFAWLRQREMPIKYTFIKVFNVVINLSFNLFFFLWLPYLVAEDNNSVMNAVYSGENSISYIFIANLIASAVTFMLMLPLYFRIGLKINIFILKKMLRYGLPILVAGIAFSINEHFDKILLKYLLPEDIAESEAGIYGACYKLGVFMTLFITAFKLGIEPFFFSYADKKDAKATYANITRYFIIFGAFILLFVVVYADVFKQLLIADAAYWEAMTIVPIILMANLCLGIYYNLSVWYKVTDRTHYGAYISVAGAIITLALNFILIPVISYKGSAIATLTAYTAMMMISWYFGQKKYPIPYPMKRIATYLLASVLFSVLSFYVLDRNLWTGTGFLFLFLAMIYAFEKKQLKRIFIKHESKDR